MNVVGAAAQPFADATRHPDNVNGRSAAGGSRKLPLLWAPDLGKVRAESSGVHLSNFVPDGSAPGGAGM
ncbi:hypothetical protein SCP_0600750 [Sparassis crispa]|uniref:Uncharacterized protein n=1 Tax=Sparassis crispa TaxID=139825 RepID=A0A401GPF0_9APHY|nr:hypothetical protein SCP_0600750 [Sparassis crispa]GBE84097.1 hypothetical protein SCP_0600750 [Sparassis crispa]